MADEERGRLFQQIFRTIFAETPSHAVVATGCNDYFFLKGSGGIEVLLDNSEWPDGPSLVFNYTGTAGGTSGCENAISSIATDNGTWNANGCDTLSISGCSGLHTSIDNDTVVICYTGVDPSSVWNYNGDDIYYDAGNVGIGSSSSPSETLDVAGNIIAQGNDVRLKLKGDTDSHPGLELYESATRKWIVYNNYVNDNLTFKTNSSIRMVVAQDGNVGIGTNNPSAKLDIAHGHLSAPSGEFSNSLTISGVPVATGSGGCSQSWNKIWAENPLTIPSLDASGCDEQVIIRGSGGIEVTAEVTDNGGSWGADYSTLNIKYTGSNCFKTGDPIASTWVEPTSCNIAAPLAVGVPVFQVVPRESDGCTFFDLSGNLQLALSGIGYQEKYVGLCENGVTQSGWILFKGCHDGS